VNGSLLCSDFTTGGSVQASVPLTQADGETVLSIRPPEGAQSGMDCKPIIATDAVTDPGKVTLLTAELFAGE
jgi:hypothetical protein